MGWIQGHSSRCNRAAGKLSNSIPTISCAKGGGILVQDFAWSPRVVDGDEWQAEGVWCARLLHDMLFFSHHHRASALPCSRDRWALRPSLSTAHAKASAASRFLWTTDLSGSTPPKSAKRSRLKRWYEKKKFENAAKKQWQQRGTIFWLTIF